MLQTAAHSKWWLMQGAISSHLHATLGACFSVALLSLLAWVCLSIRVGKAHIVCLWNVSPCPFLDTVPTCLNHAHSPNLLQWGNACIQVGTVLRIWSLAPKRFFLGERHGWEAHSQKCSWGRGFTGMVKEQSVRPLMIGRPSSFSRLAQLYGRRSCLGPLVWFLGASPSKPELEASIVNCETWARGGRVCVLFSMMGEWSLFFQK